MVEQRYGLENKMYGFCTPSQTFVENNFHSIFYFFAFPVFTFLTKQTLGDLYNDENAIRSYVPSCHVKFGKEGGTK